MSPEEIRSRELEAASLEPTDAEEREYLRREEEAEMTRHAYLLASEAHAITMKRAGRLEHALDHAQQQLIIAQRALIDAANALRETEHTLRDCRRQLTN